jgi:xanthine dehydrogenase YagS FAD-binding subunit
MQTFTFSRPRDLTAASKGISNGDASALAGGTTMLDLMKLEVLTPQAIVSIDGVTSRDIDELNGGDVIRVGAGVRMADLGEHGAVAKKLPMIRESLILAASPQIRNMASIGGNLLQHTRCPYFRDTGFPRCNKRDPGSGCDAIGEGADNRMLAVLGTSDACIAHYPGDFAVAAVACGATLNLIDADGTTRTMPVRDLHRMPGDDPSIETNLKDGELIESIDLPVSDLLANSIYFKVRDRASYAFALVSVAAALALEGDTISDARLALGGVGTVPWHAKAAESMLIGAKANEATFEKVAAKAMEGAVTQPGNAYKVPLMKEAIVAALMELLEGGPGRDTQIWEMQHGRG